MKDPEPFFKWDPDGTHARERARVRAAVEGKTSPPDHEPDTPRRPDPMAGRRWILRWAWLISSGVLLFGYLIMIVVLTGQGEHFGL